MRKILVVVLAVVLALCASCNAEPCRPEASITGGTYDGPVSVTLSSSLKNSTIYYSLDRSDPQNGIEYTGSISISRSCLLRFVTLNNKNGVFSAVSEELYSINGPAGGLVFYDCDADNDETNNGAGPDKLKSEDCGWRYLEAAPSDITDGSSTQFVFGFYRKSSNLTSLFVNGTTTYEEGTSIATDQKCTGTAVGTGKANTTKLVNVMGSSTYYAHDNNNFTTSKYAARLCDNYYFGGCDDWFLPSKDELNLMYENLKTNYIGGFALSTYWSSSEWNNSSINAPYVWFQDFSSGVQNHNYFRSQYYRVRAIRAFMSFDED